MRLKGSLILMYGLIYGLIFNSIFAQDSTRSVFSNNAITIQYAGSTGFISLGISKISRNQKFELGFLYGKVPRAFGGINRSFNIKGLYNPIQIKKIKKTLIEPVQTGVFISQNFGENLGLNWSNKYPNGYYWWNRSLRFHIFLSSQLSLQIKKKHFDKISFYIETNTNNLYIYSYFKNRRTLSLNDIFFMGSGIKFYLK